MVLSYPEFLLLILIFAHLCETPGILHRIHKRL
jgi:hypothetical protein